MRRSFTRWASALAALALLAGCVQKSYTISEPRLITLKTWQLKFNDVGFVRSSGSAVQLELFSAGQAVETISIDDEICVQKGCMSKSRFNEAYLSRAYPEELMQQVLLGRPIFGGRELVHTPDGFEQQLKAMAIYNITYRVTAKEIYFKDRINDILIKIAKIPQH